MTGPILFAYDGSEHARHAIARAAELLGPREAVVLYAWERPEHAAATHGFTVLAANETLRDADESARAYGEHVAREGAEFARAAGFQARSLVAEGDAPVWEAIVRAADDEAAALVVLGSRGLRGLRAFTLGSVSHQVAHHARSPLLVIPLPELAEARRELARGGARMPGQRT